MPRLPQRSFRRSVQEQGLLAESCTMLRCRATSCGEKRLDQALSIDANYKDALYRKALSQMAATRLIRPWSCWTSCGLDAKYKQAYNARGQALEMQGRYDAALRAYDRALQLIPNGI